MKLSTRARIHNKAHMSENETRQANLFLLILFAIFVASISLIISCCAEKITAEPIVTFVKSGSSGLMVSKLLLLSFFMILYPFA